MTATTLPPGVVRAPPLWTLSAGANAQHMARALHRREATTLVAQIVTKHPTPWHGEPVTDACRTVERAAKAAGLITRLHVYLDGCVLEGRLERERVGFRASWHRGKAGTAWWYEPVSRWVTEPDRRPVGIAKLTRTTLKGHRSPGSTSRSRLVASPRGVPVPFGELTARIKAMGARS